VEDIKPGDPPPVASNPCEHQVFEAIGAEPTGADYAHQVLYVDVYNAPRNPGVYGTEIGPRILAILTAQPAPDFKFVEGMAFARSNAERELARKRVSEYLQSLGYTVPP
jgi:hypothetical protein